MSRVSNFIPTETTRELLRIVRAAQPIPRIDVARRLGVHRGKITVLVRPLIESGVLSEGSPDPSSHGVGRPPIGLSGVNRTQLGNHNDADQICDSAEKFFAARLTSQASLAT